MQYEQGFISSIIKRTVQRTAVSTTTQYFTGYGSVARVGVRYRSSVPQIEARVQAVG